MTNANTTTAIVPAKDLNALEFRIAQGIGFSTPDEIAAMRRRRGRLRNVQPV